MACAELDGFFRKFKSKQLSTFNVQYEDAKAVFDITAEFSLLESHYPHQNAADWLNDMAVVDQKEPAEKADELLLQKSVIKTV